jgi:hypothetical protein
MVSIIQEEDKPCPDDTGRGGFITFTFRKPVELSLTSLLDIDEGNDTPQLSVYREGGQTSTFETEPTGDNGLYPVAIDASVYTDVTMVDVKYWGSGSINSLVYRYCPETPTPEIKIVKYAGPPGSCSGSGVSSLEDDLYTVPSTSDDWAYCYEISIPTSSGECLYDVQMNDPAPIGGLQTYSVTETSVLMCPGDIIYVSGSTISGSLAPEGSINATVVGTGYYSGQEVTDEDPAAVAIFDDIGMPTASPTATPATPTAKPTATPTAKPTASPTATATASPTATPATPTAKPTASPTAGPTTGPTAGPTPAPVTPAPVTPPHPGTECAGEIVILKNEDKIPLCEDAVVYHSPDGETVDVTITQCWKEDDTISWIQPVYTRNNEVICDNENDRADTVEYGATNSYTLECEGDMSTAILELFVHDGSFNPLNLTEEEDYGSNCKGGGQKNGIASYTLAIPCTYCTPGPTAGPTAGPTTGPTASPTATPTATPASPTAKPTASPTATPAADPTTSPTATPESPTATPASPTATPTASPTATPAADPTTNPTPAETLVASTPKCVPDDTFTTPGSQYCPNDSGVVALHVTGASPLPENVDILWDITGSSNSESSSVSFQVQNPFPATTKLFVNYHEPAGAVGASWAGACDEHDLGPCGGTTSVPITAHCTQGGGNPMTLVHLYFVDTTDSLNDQIFPAPVVIDECCYPGDVAQSGNVALYSFLIRCSCPTSTDEIVRISARVPAGRRRLRSERGDYSFAAEAHNHELDEDAMVAMFYR